MALPVLETPTREAPGATPLPLICCPSDWIESLAEEATDCYTDSHTLSWQPNSVCAKGEAVEACSSSIGATKRAGRTAEARLHHGNTSTPAPRVRAALYTTTFPQEDELTSFAESIDRVVPSTQPTSSIPTPARREQPAHARPPPASLLTTAPRSPNNHPIFSGGPSRGLNTHPARSPPPPSLVKHASRARRPFVSLALLPGNSRRTFSCFGLSSRTMTGKSPVRSIDKGGEEASWKATRGRVG